MQGRLKILEVGAWHEKESFEEGGELYGGHGLRGDDDIIEEYFIDGRQYLH